MAEFRISVVFLNGTYHGRKENGGPEWPPSPLRLFQALLATAAARWRMPLPEAVASALDWLAGLPAPTIVAPPARPGTPYQTAVPNNAMDIVARLWSRGNESSDDAQPAKHKSMKQIRPTLIGANPGEMQSVVFVWTIPLEQHDASSVHCEVLSDLASRLFRLGWGLDLVAGHAELVASPASEMACERWIPSLREASGSSGHSLLRIPRCATRRYLEERHERFLNRLSNKTLVPVPPLPQQAYAMASYRRAWDPPLHTIVGLGFLRLDGGGFRAFPSTKGPQVAGMLRHAVAEMAREVGWSDETVGRLVLGHGEQQGEPDHRPVGRDRLAYIPLPSIERRRPDLPPQHVGMIRRGLIYVPAGGRQREIETLRKMLAGNELTDNQGHSKALITTLPLSDNIIRRYVPQFASHSWATVTPVILPGHDDHKPAKTEALLRKSLRQAGYASELVDHSDLDWRPVGYWPGAQRVDRYFVPQHLRNYPRYHVRVHWKNSTGNPIKIPGPIVVGGGRYTGLGLFAAETDQAD